MPIQELRKTPLDITRFKTYAVFFANQPKRIRSTYRILKLVSYEYRMQRHEILRQHYSKKARRLMNEFEREINTNLEDRLHSD